MTSITIELPDELAEKAQAAGIFQPEKLSLVLDKISCEEPHNEYWRRIQANTPPSNLSDDEVMDYVNGIIHESRTTSGVTK